MAHEQGLPGGKALAELFGVTYETLRAWTADGAKIAPNRRRAALIAEVLKTTVEVVMHGSPPPPRQLDAEALADAFNALPDDSEMALRQRQWVYQAIMAQIDAAQRAGRSSAPAQEPAAQPTAAPPRQQ
jgi:hypothetical protein